MSYVDEFITDNELCSKDNQICKGMGRSVSLEKLYSTFTSGVTNPEDLMTQKDFKKYVIANSEDRSRKKLTASFSLDTVDNEEELANQALDTLKIKLSATGEEITMNKKVLKNEGRFTITAPTANNNYECQLTPVQMRKGQSNILEIRFKNPTFQVFEVSVMAQRPIMRRN